MLTVDQLLDLEDKTRVLIDDLEAAIKKASQSTGAVAPDVAIGRISRLDSIQQQEMSKAGVRRMQARLVALHEVLRQMDAGTYGMCPKCGEDIEYERLDAAPEVKCCAKCSAGR